jgi:hypothetical protein
MTSLDGLAPGGALATFVTRADNDLLPPGSPAFELDPRLLDVATHPMLSGSPERGVPGLDPGKLAYPVRAEALRLYGPRPSGQVGCRLDRVSADPHALVFDVRLEGAHGVWATFRWTEALVEGGPLLGLPAALRYPFCWRREPVESLRVGSPHGDRWRVRRADLVEPIRGTLVGLLCTATEVEAWRASVDRDAFAVERIAAKEAVRSWLRARLGRDVHPRDLQLCTMRPDLAVVTEAASLTAQEFADHVGPTRFDVHLGRSDEGVDAWVTAR